jgi:putative hydrolase of the HAD superfamily
VSSGLAAVVFDVGGVVTGSPLAAIARYEREHGLEPSAVNRAIAVAGDGGAWSRLERGELALDDFYGLFQAECAAGGLVLDAALMMRYIAEAGAPRPRMLAAIRRLRAGGLRVAALTNNWRTAAGAAARPLRAHFDVFIESSVVGLRKPDPRIYTLVCEALGVPPSRAAFLDDIGRNLKAARALGMTTIKVDDPDVALAELSRVVGLDLLTEEP